MTQYDRIVSGKATAEEIALEIKASFAAKNGPTWTKLPGHVLVEDFLVPYFPAELADLSRRAFIPLNKLRGIIRGTEKIDNKTAKSLGDFYNNGSDFWLSLQEKFERGEAL